MTALGRAQGRTRRLVVVGPNIALERVAVVPRFQTKQPIRASRAHLAAGGSGTHVARVAARLGAPVLLMGFAGGKHGELVRQLLDGEGIAHDLVPVKPETRSAVVVLDELEGNQVELVEPGERIEPSAADELESRFEAHLDEAALVILSGSLPPGIPDDLYARLIRRAHAAGVQVVIDVHSEPLKLAVEARPDLIKVNRDEMRDLLERAPHLARLTGSPSSRDDLVAAAEAMVAELGISVLLSLSEEGAVLATPEGAWALTGPSVRPFNTIGCGDSMVGGVAAGLYTGRSVLDAAVLGVAAATANLRGIRIADVSVEEVRALKAQVVVRPLEEPSARPSAGQTRVRPSRSGVDEFLSRLGTIRWSTRAVDLLAYVHDTWPLALKGAVDGVTRSFEPFLGDGLQAPAAVVWPESVEEVEKVVRAARETHTCLVPWGGGSGIVGGALLDRAGVVVDLKRMRRVVEVDTTSLLARVEAGINGQELEDKLNARGFTLGHFPQSMRSATVGGWIAHRAAGTKSTRYGCIESMVAGLTVVLASGQRLELRPMPRSAAGPDLRQLFLGGEGTLGIVTEAYLRLHRLPECQEWLGFTFSSFEEGLEAIRKFVQDGWRPAIVRLYDPVEAGPHLKRAGLDPGPALLMVESEGLRPYVELEVRSVREHCVRSGGTEVGPRPGQLWWEHRLDTSALLRTLLDSDGFSETLEVAAPWASLPVVYRAMVTAIQEAVGPSGRVYAHCSHVYQDGGNLYVVLQGHAGSPERVAEAYRRAVEAAFEACIRAGGSISHHHGVGLAKRPWLPREYGDAGWELLRAVSSAVDPEGLLNPGKLGKG